MFLLDAARRRCKVTDFGLSKSDDLNTMATQATRGGGAKGTPAYMAPELLGFHRRGRHGGTVNIAN